MTSKKNSIILCTYNEANYIKETIEKLRENINNLELIIVDDNSTDDTRNIVNDLNKEKKIKLIHRKKTRGLASAFFTGLMKVTGDNIGWIDTNMSELTIKFKEMSEAIDSGYDIVVLSRYIEGGGDNRNLIRSLSSKCINFICRIFLSSKVTDYTSGIFLFKKNILDEVTMFTYGHGEFTIEFLENANRKGCKIHEIPYVQKKDDKVTVSKTAGNLIHFFYLGLIYFIRILRIIIRKN